jgi:putative membrane protein
MIGTAEAIPGVGGGTVALLVGVYFTLIGAASTVVRAVAATFQPAQRAGAWRAVWHLPWLRLIAIGGGIVGAIVVAARILEPVIVAYPQQTRAIALGLVLASVIVPLRMAGLPLRPIEWALFLAVASLAFWLIGLPALDTQRPPGWWVFIAAVLLMFALVLPGVSGSAWLLAIGLYQPTLAAINDGNVPYLAIFGAGALLGLSSFVFVEWLLENAGRVTLVIMAGLMAGSLRSLWPWQGEGKQLLPPTDENLMALVGLFVAGVVIVLSLMLVERRLESRPGD